PELTHENNPICPHCTSQLWKEESLNCCNKGKYAIPRLRSVPGDLMQLFSTSHFRKNQRRYNGMFSFTALGAGGIEKRTWTQPRGKSILTIHGKAYHRLFDLSLTYPEMNVSNSSRFYIFDSEFAQGASSLSLRHDVANTLRTHIHTNVKWAREYR
ncbi:unnamed protein product, partial [Pylaiella littoralis]